MNNYIFLLNMYYINIHSKVKKTIQCDHFLRHYNYYISIYTTCFLSWPRLSPLQGCGILIMKKHIVFIYISCFYIYIYIYIYIYYIYVFIYIIQDNQIIDFRHVFSYVFSNNQIKNISFLTFRHLSLTSIIFYIFTLKKITYFIFSIKVKFTKLKIMRQGNKLVYE